MRKWLIGVLLVLSSLSLVAQTKYRGIIEGGYSFLEDNKSGLSFHVSTIHGAKLGWIFIGGGIGIEGDQIDNDASNIGHNIVSTTSVPIFFDCRSMWDKYAVVPMFDIRAGVSLGDVFGPFIEPGAGIRIRLYKAVAISAGVFGKLLYDPGLVTDLPPCTDGIFKQLGMRAALEF